jgi:hypothetical protein
VTRLALNSPLLHRALFKTGATVGPISSGTWVSAGSSTDREALLEAWNSIDGWAFADLANDLTRP